METTLLALVCNCSTSSPPPPPELSPRDIFARSLNLGTILTSFPFFSHYSKKSQIKWTIEFLKVFGHDHRFTGIFEKCRILNVSIPTFLKLQVCIMQFYIQFQKWWLKHKEGTIFKKKTSVKMQSIFWILPDI